VRNVWSGVLQLWSDFGVTNEICEINNPPRVENEKVLLRIIITIIIIIIITVKSRSTP
jgi:hypothetical protein